jgi:hypothetical protein
MAIAAALGQSTTAVTNTSTFLAQGLVAAGFASATAVGHGAVSPPSASAFATASALGGNLNIGTSTFIAGSTGGTTYQHVDQYASTLSIFPTAVDPFSAINAPVF